MAAGVELCAKWAKAESGTIGVGALLTAAPVVGSRDGRTIEGVAPVVGGLDEPVPVTLDVVVMGELCPTVVEAAAAAAGSRAGTKMSLSEAGVCEYFGSSSMITWYWFKLVYRVDT